MKVTNSTVNPVFDGARLGWRPPTKQTPWQWAEKNVRIQNSERSSFFEPSQTPWLMAPLECAADSETREVVLIAPTGSGKSTLAEALIPYVVSEDPGNLLYASQTDADASFWAETRLIPTLRQCESITGLWPSDRNKSRKTEIIFAHMALIVGGANLSNFQEKSVRWLYGDEVWRWAAGLVREFLARHHNRWNRKVFLVSQGGDEESELHLEWLKTPQAHFSWKCSKCKHPQRYSWDSLRFDVVENEDGTTDEQATAATARMECVSCRAQYADTAMERRALATSNTGNGNGGYIATNTKPLTGYAGFHVDSLAVWWVPWADEVLAYLEAKRMQKAGVIDKFRQWWQKRRANFWRDDMADARVELSRSDFSKVDCETQGRLENEAQRFMTVDVQGTHFWAIVQAWRNGGSSRILWEGYVPGDGRDETALTALQEKYGVKPSLVLIDIGYDTDRIFDLCALHGWTGVKGDGNKRSFTHVVNGKPVEKPYSRTHRTKSKRGPIVSYVMLATNEIKDIANRLIHGDGAELELPSDLSKAFEAHMRSERREMVRAPKTGQEQAVWITKNRQNHLWDCLVYQVGAALIFRLFGET